MNDKACTTDQCKHASICLVTIYRVSSLKICNLVTSLFNRRWESRLIQVGHTSLFPVLRRELVRYALEGFLSNVNNIQWRKDGLPYQRAETFIAV